MRKFAVNMFVEKFCLSIVLDRLSTKDQKKEKKPASKFRTLQKGIIARGKKRPKKKLFKRSFVEFPLDENYFTV